jgi:hypothetical protein
MRFTTLSVFIYVCLSINSYGQISNIVFLGTAVVKGGAAYPYKLQVNESNGMLTGYSVTDVMGANETKTSVKGTIVAEKKQIDFNETKIIYTKSAYTSKDFCFIKGHLKLTKIEGTVALKGTFKGYKEDGVTECGKGRLALFCADDILSKLLTIAGADSVRPKAKDTTSTHLEQMPLIYDKRDVPAVVSQIKPGDNIILTCQVPDVTVDVWDDKTIDGDVVSVYVNDSLILNHHTLTATPKTLNIFLGKRESVQLVVKAISEGTEDLNTARLRIKAGNKAYFVDAFTTLTQNSTVTLRRK